MLGIRSIFSTVKMLLQKSFHFIVVSVEESTICSCSHIFIRNRKSEDHNSKSTKSLRPIYARVKFKVYLKYYKH